jgi:hypothetical protein
MPVRARKTPGAVPPCLLALCLALLAGLPATAGARVVISSGSAQLTLDASLARQLDRRGVEVEGTGAATSAARVVEFPDVAGATNGAPGRGALTIVGGFAFDAGARTARIGDILVNTGKGRSTARIAGEHGILAKHGRLSTGPAGFGTRIEIHDLRLTAGTSARLNRKLGLDGVFRPGRRLGSLLLVAIPETVPVDSGTIAIGGPGTAFSKLESIEAQPGVWGGTQRWAAPGENYFLFDVAPTAVAPDASSGILESGANDGVTMEIFAAPPRNMLLRGPRIDLATGELTATVSALSQEGPITAPIATLDYAAGKIQIRPRVGAFELIGIPAVANQFIAEQLNARFLTPGLFQAGETLARITVTLDAAQSAQQPSGK